MSGTSERRQHDLLAEVYELAQLRHALGRLEDDVRLMLEQAERNAAWGNVPPSLIARAAGVTPGRVTQVLGRSDEDDALPSDLRLTAIEIFEWMAEAVETRRADFPGLMTYPPYPAPRRKPQEPR